MATLKIHRTSSFADLARAYAVVLDGKTIGTLAAGETGTFEIPAGEHRLRLAVDWCGSKELAFSATPGATHRYSVRSALGGWRLLLALWYVLVERDAYLLLEPSP